MKKPLAIENVHYLPSSFHISKPLVFHRGDEHVPYLRKVKDVFNYANPGACDQKSPRLTASEMLAEDVTRSNHGAAPISAAVVQKTDVKTLTALSDEFSLVRAN